MRHRARQVDKASVGDNVTIEVRDAAGELLQRVTTHNLVVDAGLSLQAARLVPTGPAGLTHFAVGIGAAAPAASNTVMGAEKFRDVITQYIPSTKKLTVRYYLATGSANGYTLTECGLFTAASGGTLYARAVHEPIAKTNVKTVTYSWELNMATV